MSFSSGLMPSNAAVEATAPDGKLPDTDSIQNRDSYADAA
jgi:hypothetical protein